MIDELLTKLINIGIERNDCQLRRVEVLKELEKAKKLHDYLSSLHGTSVPNGAAIERQGGAYILYFHQTFFNVRIKCTCKVEQGFFSVAVAYIFQIENHLLGHFTLCKIYAPVRESRQKLQSLVYKAQAVEESLETLQRQFDDTKTQVERAQADFWLMKNSQCKTFSPSNLVTRDTWSSDKDVLENARREAEEYDVDQNYVAEQSCSICNVQFNNVNSANSHYNSPGHAKKIKHLGEMNSVLKNAKNEAQRLGIDPTFVQESKCDVCHVKFDPMNCVGHYTSPGHIKRMETLSELGEAVRRAKEEAEEQGVGADLLQNRKCGVCNTQLDTPTIAITHYSSAAHKKRVDRVRIEEGVVERARRDARKLGLGSASVLESLEDRRWVANALYPIIILSHQVWSLWC